MIIKSQGQKVEANEDKRKREKKNVGGIKLALLT